MKRNYRTEFVFLAVIVAAMAALTANRPRVLVCADCNPVLHQLPETIFPKGHG